jgi:glycerophosphoryl diester phosphodiesterase
MKKEELMKSVDPRFFKGICHRGYHNSKDTENGLRAFKNALDNDMALELDVHLTKDDELVVIHDSDTKRVTGKDGIIEDMTLAQIKDGYHLLDGESIPTLKEVFDLIQEQVPIVIELKVYNRNYKALAKRLGKELSHVHDKSKYMLISFDPRALVLFKGCGFLRQLLVAHDGKHEYVYQFRHLFEGVDLEYTFLEMKKIQRYSKNHIVNIWTVEKEDIVTSSLPYVDTITFQNIDADFVRDKLKNRK